MTRQDYIAGLEEIRKQVKQIGQAFAAVDLTDATGMESDRHRKTRKLIGDLCDRLYEDIAISAKVAADNAEAGIGEQGDLFEGAAEAAEAETVSTPLALPAPEPEPEPEPEPAPEPDETDEDPFNGAEYLCDGDEPKTGKKTGKKPGKRGKKGSAE